MRDCTRRPRDGGGGVFRRVFRTIAVTIDTSSLASVASPFASGAGPNRHFTQIRSLVQDSRHSLRPMQHFEMKSRRLSAARASSSMLGTDVLQANSCGTIIRDTPPASYNF